MHHFFLATSLSQVRMKHVAQLCRNHSTKFSWKQNWVSDAPSLNCLAAQSDTLSCMLHEAFGCLCETRAPSRQFWTSAIGIARSCEVHETTSTVQNCATPLIYWNINCTTVCQTLVPFRVSHVRARRFGHNGRLWNFQRPSSEESSVSYAAT